MYQPLSALKFPRVSGLVPEVETIKVVETEFGQYEIVQISSLGGAVWLVNRVDELEAPRYYYSKTDLNNFIKGVST